MFRTYFGDFKSIDFSYNIYDGNRFAMSIKIFNFFPTTQARLLKLLKDFLKYSHMVKKIEKII